MKIVTYSAIAGCAIILLQFCYLMQNSVGYAADLADWNYVRALAEAELGALLFALPALVLLFADGFRKWVRMTAILYPLILTAGFWIANTIDDGLGYAIWMATILLPFVLGYAISLIIDSQTLKLRPQNGN